MKRIILLCLSVLFCFSACSMPQTQLTEEKNTASESEKFAGVWLTYAELSVKGKAYTEEPKYQDTMANEIARIIEYINSAKIL